METSACLLKLYTIEKLKSKDNELIICNHLCTCVSVSSRNNLQSEEIVSELVYSFLIPEVERARVRQIGLGDCSVSTRILLS